MTLLKVDHIKKHFGTTKAVNGISFSVGEGIVFGLLGPNGAGKTTTIRMITNIIAPDSGKISILGNPSSRSIMDYLGYLPEERGLYRKMKVGELLRFMSELKSVSRSERRKSIAYWLDRVDLLDWEKKKVEELSKGMQQKILFVGTLLHNPRILILDEPFGGLDPINQNLIKDILMEIKKKGTTILFSTHVMESAEKLCEEIFLINKGEKVVYGKLNDIKQGFGKRNIHIEYEGKDDFLTRSSEIKKFDNYGNYVEIQLKEKGDSQKLLKEAATSATIRKFEMIEPSLHDIFIDAINNSSKRGDQKS
jgi:ABC-2 type transport system ATP-binding protein